MDEIDGYPSSSLARRNLDRSICLSLARLTEILHQMIRARLDGADPADGLMENQAVEHRLESQNLESLLARLKHSGTDDDTKCGE